MANSTFRVVGIYSVHKQPCAPQISVSCSEFKGIGNYLMVRCPVFGDATFKNFIPTDQCFTFTIYNLLHIMDEITLQCFLIFQVMLTHKQLT